MSLFELVNNTTIQGDVKIRVFNADGDEIDSKELHYMDDLSMPSVELPEEWEDMEVRYMYYAADFLNIEIYKEDNE